MRLFRYFLILYLFSLFSVYSHAQPAKGFKWAKDGSSYYDISDNNIVKYELPSLKQTVIIESSKPKPDTSGVALQIQNFTFSDDEKKLLIFTNSKRVWRQNTKGDYWILDRNANSLKQLGKGMPASSLMFAKISPDGTKAAYVSEHNIYMEDLIAHQIKALTKDGTARLINIARPEAGNGLFIS